MDLPPSVSSAPILSRGGRRGLSKFGRSLLMAAALARFRMGHPLLYLARVRSRKRAFLLSVKLSKDLIGRRCRWQYRTVQNNCECGSRRMATWCYPEGALCACKHAGSAQFAVFNALVGACVPRNVPLPPRLLTRCRSGDRDATCAEAKAEKKE